MLKSLPISVVIYLYLYVYMFFFFPQHWLWVRYDSQLGDTENIEISLKELKLSEIFKKFCFS